MKKYIKSILTSRKQLMLPLMLVSGGIMRAQTAVPDTIYVSFNAADPVTMTYGQDMNTVVSDAGLTGSSFSYLYVKAEDGTASDLNGTVSFKDSCYRSQCIEIFCDADSRRRAGSWVCSR